MESTAIETNCAGRKSPIRQEHRKSETAAIIVTAITLITMGAEIAFGLITGSIALLADGLHMGTHAFALLITSLAYLASRKLEKNPSFSFGTGKIGVLGGYTNALILGVTAVLMIAESVKRLLRPQAIAFDEAIIVAILGLLVNIACAAILNAAGKGHGHDHDHGETHGHGERRDSNMRAAFVHVMTDALTSVLAIGSLVLGKYLGWAWLDAGAGLLGAAMIIIWAVGLAKDSSAVLLDFGDYSAEIGAIRGKASAMGVSIEDIHIWRYSENERSLLLSLCDPRGRSVEELKSALLDAGHYHHATIEVNAG
jgi:cation diffusion facilitator family transporter